MLENQYFAGVDDDDDDDKSLPVIVSIWPCTYWRAGSGVLRELFQSPRPRSASWRLGDSVPYDDTSM